MIFLRIFLTLPLIRHRLHGRGFQSKRFHDLETASKTTRFQGVYTEPIQPLIPTVYVKAISFSGRIVLKTLHFLKRTHVFKTTRF